MNNNIGRRGGNSKKQEKAMKEKTKGNAIAMLGRYLGPLELFLPAKFCILGIVFLSVADSFHRNIKLVTASSGVTPRHYSKTSRQASSSLPENLPVLSQADGTHL